MNTRRWHRVVLTVAALGAALPSLAHGYVDPGSGSILLQALIASVAAAGAVVRVYWSRIRKILRGRQAEEGRDGR